MSWVYSNNKKTADFSVNTNIVNASEWISGNDGWFYLDKQNWEDQDIYWQNWSKDSTGSYTSIWSPPPPDPFVPYQNWEIQDVYFSPDLRTEMNDNLPFYQDSEWNRHFERCFLINNDGTKVWTGMRVREFEFSGNYYNGLWSWDLSTPYDLETATANQLEVVFQSPSNADSVRWNGIAWGKDGMGLYVWIENANTASNIYYFELDTPYVLSTDQPSVKQYGPPDLSWSLSPNNNGHGLDVHPEAGYVFFNRGGGVNDDIARLTMTNGIIDSTTPDQTLSIPDVPINQYGAANASVRVFDNGTKMSITARNGNVYSGGKWEDNLYGINFYSLSVPYDLTSTVTLLKHISLAEDPEANPGNRISWIGGVGSGQYWSPDGAWMLDASSLNFKYHFLKLDFRGN